MTRKTHQIVVRMAVLAVLAVLAHLFGQPESLKASDAVRVIDGDSLIIGGETVRLLGIDAPEAKQSCTAQDGSTYGCGVRSAKHLRHLIASQAVQCTRHGGDQYQRILAICRAGEVVLNQRMVQDGWALTFRNDEVDYSPQQRRAKRDAAGLWAGSFMHPREWKKRNPR